jgi:uncharacterized membrane protein YccC
MPPIPPPLLLLVVVVVVAELVALVLPVVVCGSAEQLQPGWAAVIASIASAPSGAVRGQKRPPASDMRLSLFPRK